MNMKRHFLLILLTTVSIITMNAERDKSELSPNTIAAAQNFRIEVFETSDTSALIFDQPQDISSRGFISDIWNAMRASYGATLSGQIASASADILSSSVGLLVEALRSKKGDWMAQVKKDCSFSKTLNMPVEIHDFYATTTSKGAMDPDGILFDGFGCSQYYTYRTDSGEEKRIPSLYVKCRLKKDEDGKNRILHHGKFEVEVEKFYVNPSTCNIPNDSLNTTQGHLRTPFDFDRRKNLKINLNATVLSSWMNEAIQIVKNQELGMFTISLVIPSEECLVKDGPFRGWYVYDTERTDLVYDIKPTVTGDCFIVPRSFIGTNDGNSYSRVWGTGQYKIDMTLSESCDINMDFYYETTRDPQLKTPQKLNPKWNQYWSEEWNKMKKRRKAKGFWRDIADNIMINYKNGRWIYTLTQPIQDCLLSKEQVLIDDAINHVFGLNQTTSTTPKTTTPSNNNMPQK